MVRMKRTVVLSATVIVVLLLAAPSYADVLLTGADWQMNETSGQMIDSSGNNNNGDPTDVRQRGSRYVFNGSTSYVLLPDSDSLDPQEKDITLRARVKVTDAPMDEDSYDIVRKGLSSTPGGDYKMEIKRAADPTVGKLHCLFKGDGGTVDKVARRHQGGLGRLDLQPYQRPGGSQNGRPARRCVRRFDGLRGHRDLPIEDGAAGSDPRRAEA